MDYYLWSKPQNKRSFHTQANKRHSFLLWGGSKAAPGHLSSNPRPRPEHKPGPSDPLTPLREAAGLGDPDRRRAILPSSLHPRSPAGKPVWKVNQQGFPRIFPNWIPALGSGCKTVTLRCDSQMEFGQVSKFPARNFNQKD